MLVNTFDFILTFWCFGFLALNLGDINPQCVVFFLISKIVLITVFSQVMKYLHLISGLDELL